MKNLAAALAQVQRDLPVVVKAKTAAVGKYSYRYAGLPDVTAAVMPLLAENGLSFIAHPRPVEGGGYELAATLLHTSGESITGALPINGRTPQEIGSAITYARRYLIGCLTGVVTDDDDDGHIAARAQQKQQRRQPAAPPQEETGEAVTPGTLKSLVIRMKEAHPEMTDQEWHEWLSRGTGRQITSRKHLTEREAKEAIHALNQHQQQQRGSK